MRQPTDQPRLHIRISFGPKEMMGPGKAALLEHIERTGSIAAAGRQMGMSYKRAWQLVEALNAMFRVPLVESTRGGAKGGGALITETGRAVLSEYRALEAATLTSGAAHIDRLRDMLGDVAEAE